MYRSTQGVSYTVLLAR